MDHMVESKLSQVKLFGLDELLLEDFDILDQTNSSSLVQVSRLVDPHALTIVVHEINLVRHQVESVSFGNELIDCWEHFLALLLQI